MALLGRSADRPAAWAAAGPRRGARWAYLARGGLAGGSAGSLTVFGLLVLAPVGLLSATRGFDGLYGQDAFAYFDYAVGPLRQAVLRGQLVPPPAFFWPPGFPVLVTLASLVVGAQALAGQLVSLLMGACVPVATALLARELWPGGLRLARSSPWGLESCQSSGRRAPSSAPARRALLAGGMTAVCGQLWQSSAVVMSDTTGLALATLGVWSAVRYTRAGRPAWLLMAAALLGWAIITRWIYALVALVAAVFVLLTLLRSAPRRLVTHGLPAALVGAGILAWVLLPAVSQAAFLGTLETYGSETWSLANIIHREFLTTGHGFVRYSLPNGLYYAGAPLHPFMLTPLLGVLALRGVLVLVGTRQWAQLGLLVGWAVAMYAFHAGSTWQNLRYILAYLPPVAILAAVGADTLLDRWTRAASLWIAAGVVWAAAGGVVLTNQFIDRKQADLAMVRWVDAQLPPDAELLTFGPTLTFRHYGRPDTRELFELSPDQLAQAPGRPRYLLLDVANVEQQWAGRAPAENYHWLRDGPGLTPLGTTEDLTLFRVGGA